MAWRLDAGAVPSWGRQRLQVDFDVRHELWKDFFAALNLFYTLDSALLIPEAAHTDVGVVASLGWSF